MGFPFLICSIFSVRLLLGTEACFASLFRSNLAAGAFVAVLVLADVVAVALMDDAVDELEDDAVSGLVCDVEPVVVGKMPVLETVAAEAMSVSSSLGFAVSVAFVGKFCTGAGSKFV